MNSPARLSWPTLATYGVLALPLAALNLPLYVYLPTFYSTVLGIPLATIGTTLLVARLIDMVADPFLGELTDRTRSRWGQRRPWLVAVTPLLLFATFMLFVPPEGVGAPFLLFWSVVAYVAWTLMLLTYAAWGAELTGDYHERTRVTASREIYLILGIVTAVALPAVLRYEPSSREALGTLFWMMAITLPVALVLLLAVVPEPLIDLPTTHLSLREGVSAALHNPAFVRLVSAYLLNSLANGLPATLFLLFCTHVLQAGAQAGLMLLIYFASGMVSVPFWVWLSYRAGKNRTWAWSMLWACVVFAYVPFLGPGDIWAFGIACVLSGFSLGADLSIPASMQADVVDLDRVMTGRRRTGLFFALWSMVTKLASALAVGIAFPLLQLMGLDPAASTNSSNSLLGLALLYAGAPVLLKLAAVALVWRFPIDVQTQAELRQQIAEAGGLEDRG